MPVNDRAWWRERIALWVILLFAGALRFYGLAWGAPYFHFHIDEHFVFVGADQLRVSMKAAATSNKFFMYGPVPMHLLNALQFVYERVTHPLSLAVFQDQVTYMVLGRAISAAMGTATVLVTYLVGTRVSNRTGGLVAAALAAGSVIHIAESHSFRVDLTMVFFVAAAWLFALRIADEGRWRDYILAGVCIGAAIGSKYSAAFILGVVGFAHLLTLRHPQRWNDIPGWPAWTARGLSALVVSVLTFAIVNPMAVLYYDKFRQDIVEQIVAPLTGASKPIWIAQFTDVQPQLYWLTTNLWWGFGPAFEVWGLLGVVWLFWRRTRPALIAASFSVVYLLTAGGTIAPMARYSLPLTPGLAVAAGALSAYLVEQKRWRRAAIAATVVVVGSTSLYAVAYTNVYRAPDARLEASKYLVDNVRADSHILVEPSHSIPPTGAYLRNPDFHGDHVLWGAKREQHDYYSLYTLDAYVYLYSGRNSPEQKQEYIKSRLALVDYIVMDDFYLQLYQHLPESEHAVVKQYYRDLFSGQLGFDLIKTFKVYPAVFGLTINDDDAELSSRMNDHPRVYIFKRRQPT